MSTDLPTVKFASAKATVTAPVTAGHWRRGGDQERQHAQPGRGEPGRGGAGGATDTESERPRGIHSDHETGHDQQPSTWLPCPVPLR